MNDRTPTALSQSPLITLRGQAQSTLLSSFRLSSSLLLLSSLLLSSLLLGGCQNRFRIYSKATHNFPETWTERIERDRAEKAKARSVNAPPKRSPVGPQKQTASSSPKQVKPPQISGPTERIAVLELANRAPKLVSRDEVAYLTNELRTVASYLPSPKFLVLTQESLEALIDPTKSLEDCVGSCAVETGRLVGARWILTGEVVRFGSSLRVSLKIHDTKSGQFLKGASVKGKSVEDLESALHIRALSLTKEVAPEWGRWLDEIAPNDLTAQLNQLRGSTN